MEQKSFNEEIKERVPRIVVNSITALIFWFVSVTAPLFVKGIVLPGIGVDPYNDAGWLVWAAATLLGLVFLVRALSDGLVLVDIAVEVTVRRLGVKEDRPLRRVARDLVYILLTILLAAAAVPFIKPFPQFGDLLTTTISFVALGIFLILIYDMGRTLYTVLEEKTKAFAAWLAGIAEKAGERKTS
ncbi:TPA: hypothetical protein EYP70_03685 [Candidatus Bathyarchaeota archaeon]|nr:hypothetical protein [Candidatus Bathyarchaeota archaeon]